MRRFQLAIVLLAIVFFQVLPGWSLSEAEQHFEMKVRPLLEAKCLMCHGSNSQMGNLRLDRRVFVEKGGFSGALAEEDGQPESSLLIQKVLGTAEGERMPMNMDPLDEDEIEILKQWVVQGMIFPEAGDETDEPLTNHWAFQPRNIIEPPQVDDQGWVKNPIDQFVLKKLEDKGYAPSPQSDKETLVRRLYLDLTGLNPEPDELEAFLSDSSPKAYENLVDRLLASPHFGERWGRHWLDLARYADSDGYEKDLPRPYAWRYRDWVINAINDDLPFDQFTTQQLAGDLLPDSTLEQLIATGFHRNTLKNREGGVDPEEYRVISVKDRASTTGQVWLGLTVACAECHNHKYDPISQEEFYGMFAFFNKAKAEDVSAPFQDELQAYQEDKVPYDSVHNRLVDAFEAFQEEQFPKRLDGWLGRTKAPAEDWELLKPVAFSAKVDEVTHSNLADGSILVGGKRAYDDRYEVIYETKLTGITAFQLETLTHEQLPRGGSGRSNQGDFVISELKIEINDKPIALKEATADFAQAGWAASQVMDGSAATGWSVRGSGGREHRLVIVPDVPVGDGEQVKIKLIIEQNFGTVHNLGRFRVYATTYGEDTMVARDMSVAVAQALKKQERDRNAEEKMLLAQYYAEQDSVYQQLKQAVETHRQTAPNYPNTYIQALTENESPPDTHLMERGDFLRPAQQVEPHTLAVLPQMRARNGEADRLDLARWLMSEQNPLTSRVAVNRVWQYLFGAGLVRTPEDFGTRGEKPTHPALLDWLAEEYIRLGWSRKALIKLIVMSNTYQQSSATRPEIEEFDPKNEMLARQNRYRLEGELLRDLALQTSGLLSRKIGGPSIRPPLPEDIAELGYANSVRWQVSQGDDRYRRGMYIFFQRTVPYPMLMTFDCPDSNVSIVSRNRSNTPLQALTLLNDVVFFECAQNLGYRVIDEGPASTLGRLSFAFELCLARQPNDQELKHLRKLFNQFYQVNLQYPKEAEKMLLDDHPDHIDKHEVATWIALSRVLLNLEEFMTRE